MGKDVIVYLKSLGYVRHLPSAFDVKRVYPFLSAVGATVADDFETENLPFLMLKEKLEKEFDEVEFMEAPVSNPILEI